MNIHDEDIEKFINNIPYYKNNQNYCLGNSMKEAGKIIGIIVDNAESSNVEMD